MSPMKFCFLLTVFVIGSSGCRRGGESGYTSPFSRPGGPPAPAATKISNFQILTSAVAQLNYQYFPELRQIAPDPEDEVVYRTEVEIVPYQDGVDLHFSKMNQLVFFADQRPPASKVILDAPESQVRVYGDYTVEFMQANEIEYLVTNGESVPEEALSQGGAMEFAPIGKQTVYANMFSPTHNLGAQPAGGGAFNFWNLLSNKWAPGCLDKLGRTWAFKFTRVLDYSNGMQIFSLDPAYVMLDKGGWNYMVPGGYPRTAHGFVMDVRASMASGSAVGTVIGEWEATFLHANFELESQYAESYRGAGRATLDVRYLRRSAHYHHCR